MMTDHAPSFIARARRRVIYHNIIAVLLLAWLIVASWLALSCSC